MATPFVQAAAPLVVRQALDVDPALRRRLTIATIVCATWPDLDMLAYALERRPPDVLAHEGLTHSLLACAIAALAAGVLAFRALGIGTPAWRRVVLFLFGAGVGHGVLEALTAGDPGVAFFAPLSAARVTSPWKLLPSLQTGLDEMLGFWGLLTIANEILYVLVPLALVVALREKEGDRRRLQRLGAGWLVLVVAARIALPDWFTPVLPRVVQPVGSKDAGDPADIPHDDLPDGKLVTSFARLRELGLFDRELVPQETTWSSSFFPSWFGGEAGRWSEPTSRLVGRTLFGFAPPTEAEAKDWLARAAKGDAAAEERLFTLAPTEKIDLVLGRLDFPAQRQALLHSHGKEGLPRYWSGRCNGVANASIREPEPFRVVDVIGVDGSHVRFHPNDVKSLLAVAYYHTKVERWIGAWCETVAFDAAATCSMNPAVLVLAAANRLGLARRSFLIDALPTTAIQYYAVASARLHVVRAPHPPDGAPIAPAFAGKVRSLADVSIDLVLGSTTLSYARANVREDATHYARVGLVPVKMHYDAELAIDANGDLAGGRWTGQPPDGPDAVLIGDGGPAVLDDGRLVAADRIPWALVRAIARASVDAGAETPTVDVRTCEGCR